MAIFHQDMKERKDADYIDSRYNENLSSNRPNLVEVTYKNIQYFQERHDENWYIATHLDEPLRSEVNNYTAEFIILNKLEGMSVMGWPKSAEKSCEDMRELLENGHSNTKIWITVYANARLQNRGHDEDAVEGAIADLWTIGIPAYRLWTRYPSNTGSYHTDLSGPLTQHDIDVLMNVSGGELFMDPETRSMTTLWTRLNELKEDGTTESFITMPNGERRYLLE